MIDLDNLARAAEQMEALPESAVSLTGLFAQEEWCIDDIKSVVALDGALTARLLRAANSASHFGVEEVTSVERAVLRLGPGRVIQIAVGAAVRAQMMEGVPELEAEEGACWKHTVTTALAVEMLALVSDEPVPPEAFTAALLHDAGWLLVGRYLQTGTLKRLAAAHREAAQAGAADAGSPGDSLAAERAIIGLDHAELGASVAERWGLPAVLVDTLRWHHAPEAAGGEEVKRICDAIVVAELVAHRLGASGVEPPTGWASVADSAARLGLSEDHFEELGQLVEERLEETLALYQ